MTTPQQRKRVSQNRRLKERIGELDRTLVKVWRWTTFDGEDIETLRRILLEADKDAAVHEAMDRLEMES